jgi:hypothetical protein
MTVDDSAIEKLEGHLRSDQSRVFLDVWKAWRGSETAPRRSQAPIEDLGKVLPYTVVLEFVSELECLFQFTGSNIVELAGEDQTGTNFFEVLPPEHREVRIARNLLLEKHPCGSFFKIETTLKGGAPMLRESLGLPILPDSPDGHFRMIYVNTPLSDTSWQMPIREGIALPLASDYRYVDIGAGVPERTSDLNVKPALSL